MRICIFKCSLGASAVGGSPTQTQMRNPNSYFQTIHYCIVAMSSLLYGSSVLNICNTFLNFSQILLLLLNIMYIENI